MTAETDADGGGEGVVSAISRRLPAIHLLTDEAGRESHRLDETPHGDPGLPLAVALPTTTAEVSGLVRLCAEHGVPIVPRGAGTGLSGGATGIAGALTVAFTAMDRILEIDPHDLVARVQPGVVNADLQAAVAAEGLFYPPDPASYETSTIGGNIATNAGGLCCVKYGATRASVLSLEVVLADGTVIRTGGRLLKDVAGYALTQLFIGSEGTLGLITEATLRLRPQAPPRTTLLAFFPTLDGAGRAVSAMIAAGLDPAVLELLDRTTLQAIEGRHGLGLDTMAAAMLLVESDLPAEAALSQLDRAASVCEAEGATQTVRATDTTESDLLRQARRLALRAVQGLGTLRLEDVGVPRQRVADLLRAIERIAADHGVAVATYGHAGDGNLHPHFIFEPTDPAIDERYEVIRHELYLAAVDLGGTVTAEHGIGATRVDVLEAQVGPGALAVMQRIRSALDPTGLFNPGRAIPPPSR
ncbi:MAG TPA: FAD-linked oxidase C-terminal domain-containing protein [Candidatus Binatia bacterium]|nr:FAD-linked oxidase C-terminal domain-containing protein [Candidatus Binatia bacterium]